MPFDPQPINEVAENLKRLITEIENYQSFRQGKWATCTASRIAKLEGVKTQKIPVGNNQGGYFAVMEGGCYVSEIRHDLHKKYGLTRDDFGSLAYWGWPGKTQKERMLNRLRSRLAALETA